MKNLFYWIVIISMFTPVTNAQVVTGGIEYSVAQARQELSEKIMPLDKKIIRENIYDINRIENINCLLKGVTELKDRSLAYFSDGSYGVIYRNNPKTVLYYGHDGLLTHSEIKETLEYPYKSYKYNTAGYLVNMSLRVSEQETYMFNSKGVLIAHWLGNNCYDLNNNIIMTRELLK